ncbi:acyl-CoA dehydrogenase family protein [Alcaligenaceae bacterium]|nr:acyl-CoA dehydrogenase family protein [Alcaligenaceae bacterium]
MTVIWNPQLDEPATQWQALADRLGNERFGPLAPELDRDQRYPWESIEALVEHKFTGLFLPRQWGGEGANLVSTIAAVETLGKHCSSTAAIMCAYQLGAFPILLAGSNQQKDFYLREMAQGRATSFALSERIAGSDAAAIEASAVREGDNWRITGEKYWIGNGGASRYYVVFAKTDPEAGGRGVSAFMVDKEQAGVIIDDYSDKMGIRGTLTSNLKLDLLVPDSARVGEVNRALRLALQTLNVGRIMVAAQSMGLALAAFHEAAKRAVQRKTFGQPIGENQGIGFKLADMATEISAARMMLYQAAAAYDRGDDVSSLGAMTKLFTSEVAHRAANNAVQIWGGLGYCKPTVVERLYRDQRILEIYEGSSEIQRLVLARAIRKAAEESGS